MKPPKKTYVQPVKGRKLQALAGLFASFAGIFMLLCLATLVLPKSLNPFYPLRPTDPIGPLTKWKLQAFALDSAACYKFLRAASVGFTPVPDTREQSFCHVTNAVRLTSGGPPLYPNAPQMSCQVAAGLVLWERQGLAQAARDMMGTNITRIDHIGTYNCRRQYGKKTGWVSEHASANAIDIQGFTFADGTKVTVLDDWNPKGGEPTRAANFLRMAQQKGCDVFKVVLGPQANAAHKNHFHLDMGPLSSCR